MTSGPKKRPKAKRQPADNRLPNFWLNKSPGRRVKRLSLRFSLSRRLLITLRQFRTSPQKRSTRTKQLVIKTRFLSVRELAISVSSTKARAKKRAAHQSSAKLFRTPPRVALPTIFIILGVAGAIYFAQNLHHPANLNLAHSTKSVVLSEATPQKPSVKILSGSMPVHLRIPSIAVDTDITTMGLGADGEIQMPERYDIAAWYTGSPTPGQLGPAIIAGHVDNYQGSGVFFRLRELQVGDTIEIDRSDGSTATFKVVLMKEYSKDNFPTADVYGNISYAGVRVITCGGTFSNVTYNYSDNIVAYGALE